MFVVWILTLLTIIYNAICIQSVGSDTVMAKNMTCGFNMECITVNDKLMWHVF